MKITDGDLHQQVMNNVQIDYISEDLMNGSCEQQAHNETTYDSSSDDSVEHLNMKVDHFDSNMMSLMHDALNEFEFNEADVDILMEL